MPPERTIKLASIYAVAPKRLSGYIEEILKRGSINDNIVTLSEEDFQDIKKKFTPKVDSNGNCANENAPTKFELPSLKTMAKTATSSTIKWITSGAKATDEETLKTRLDACHSCEFWNSEALRGTGRCMKCGCSTWAKLRMATERCPIGKW